MVIANFASLLAFLYLHSGCVGTKAFMKSLDIARILDLSQYFTNEDGGKVRLLTK